LGSAGGLLGWAVLFPLPVAVGVFRETLDWTPTKPKVVAALVLVVVFVLAGGAIAGLAGDVTGFKQAFAYGLGAEAVLGGSVKAAVPEL
jgi:hypothetical protein